MCPCRMSHVPLCSMSVMLAINPGAIVGYCDGCYGQPVHASYVKKACPAFPCPRPGPGSDTPRGGGTLAIFSGRRHISVPNSGRVLNIINCHGGRSQWQMLSIYLQFTKITRYIHRRFESPCVLYQQSTFTIYILWYILLNVMWCVMMVWWFLFINVTEGVKMAWQDMQYLVKKKKKSLTDCRCDNMSPQTAGDSCVLCSKKATCKCSGCWQVSSV